ncbi:hypothetical protein M3Y97_00435700 [Aphelenchoides bicaudatus]|nr:hypothetical protein M3Y97_00435700 [Aphelenchoides bicaudatus]
MSSDANQPPIDQPSTSGAGNTAYAGQAPTASGFPPTSYPMEHRPMGYPAGSEAGYAYGQQSQPPYYYPPQQQQVQRSPIPPPNGPSSDGHPQIMVPRPDQQSQSIQHSPASARRPMSGAGWPMSSNDPNDPNSHQLPPHYPPMGLPQQPHSQQPMQHGYPPQGMAPQVPSQHYGAPKMEGYQQNGPNEQMHMQPIPVSAAHSSHQMPPSSAPSGMEDEEAKRRMQAHLSPAPGYPPHQGPPQPMPGMHRPPMHPQMMHPHMAQGQIPPYIATQYTHMLKPAQKEAVEKLVGVPNEMVPVHTIPQRREFFEKLVLLNDEQGEQLTAPPQVSKSPIDLHRLYIAVRKRGGFEQVTKEKSWKALCSEANSRMTESSAAGYQLRRHYQKHLLALECRETGQNAEELKQFAEKLKKKKKEKEETGPATPAQASSTAGPQTPQSTRSAATPTPQHGPAQPQPSPSFPPQPAHGQPPQGQSYGAPPAGDPNAYYYQQQNPNMPPNAGPMPPPWPHASYPQPGYPQMRVPPANAPYYPPNQQQPVTSMEYQPQPAQNLGAHPLQDRPSSSMSSTATGQALNSSRPPSQAPNQQNYLPPTTPDNRGQYENRPTSGQPPIPGQHKPPGHIPTSNASALLGQPPPQVPPGSHGMYPPPGQHQPGMWPPPHHQPPHSLQQPMNVPPQSQPPRFGMPGKPQHPQMQQNPNAPAQVPQPDFKRPHVQPPYFQPGSTQQMPSPGSMQRQRQSIQQPLQPSTSSSSHHSQRHMQSGQMPFIPSSLEATATKMAFSRRRMRVFARDYAGIPQRRLMMSLRSAQEMEVKWALNALTALLYDDTQHPLRLDQTDPQLLNLLVEHLRATLALLYPDVDFHVNVNSTPMDGIYDYEPEESDTEDETEKKTKLLTTPSSSRVKPERQIRVESVKKPAVLQRMCAEENKTAEEKKSKEDPELIYLRQQMELGRGSCFADRIYRNLKARLDVRRALPRPTYSLADRLKEEGRNVQEDKSNGVDDGYNSDRENNEESISFYYRRNYKHEVWDRFGQPDCSLLPRPAPLNERDPIVQELVDRCICLSNLIRGLAFVPINCRYMHSHRGLLNICAKLLMLCVREDEQQLRAKHSDARPTIEVKKEAKNGEEEPMEVDVPKKVKTIDDHFNGDEQSKLRAKQCAPEKDSDAKLLLETANQLRDDAFVVVSQLSVHLDLYSMDSEISYPLLDALLHWAVTTNIQAQDPIHPSVISPKAYVFEIISKLSLLDKNIDLLLSTGSWPRIEEFVRVVCSSITMAEELTLREFAIVILQAISVASEPVCIVASMETNVIHNLISFLEIADQAMTAIANTDGLAALRDNTERIGTSIGMLRRAIQVLFNFVQHEPCRPYFVRHQDKLLSFTVSSIMDSRVAIAAASILFDIQNLPADHVQQGRELTAEDYSELSGQFYSCNWRLDDNEEMPDEKSSILPAILQPLEFAPNSQALENTGLVAPHANILHEPSLNGVDPVAINGSSKPKRKRTLRRPDGTEMSELEKAMLRDSDAESVDDEAEPKQSQSSANLVNHSTSMEPTRKTVSESVKEKLHNHILKHEHGADAELDEPEAKRQRIVGNGVISPKCNGDLNSKSRPSASNQQNQKAENGTPGNGSGSLTAVA